MQYIDKTMYWLSSGLLIPVMIAVLFFLVKALMLIGSMYHLHTRRLRFKRDHGRTISKLNGGNINDLAAQLNKETGLLPNTLSLLFLSSHSPVHREKQIVDFEMICEKDLDASRTLSKMGPILGLMGTLIPMGPALAGLASGDIATMSQQMQIAFNTTVLGLVIGSIGFISLQLKQRWYTEDLNTIEFVNDLIKDENEKA
jgi:biopolymer transport protein ExbB/TolQ